MVTQSALVAQFGLLIEEKAKRMTGKEARAHAEAAIRQFSRLGKAPPIVDLDAVERKAEVRRAAQAEQVSAPLTRKDFSEMLDAVRSLADQVQDLEETMHHATTGNGRYRPRWRGV